MIQVAPGSQDFAETRDLQDSQASQESQEPTPGQERVDFLVSLGPLDQRERRVLQVSRVTALKDRLVPPDWRDHQDNPDLPDPQVQVSQA